MVEKKRGCWTHTVKESEDGIACDFCGMELFEGDECYQTDQDAEGIVKSFCGDLCAEDAGFEVRMNLMQRFEAAWDELHKTRMMSLTTFRTVEGPRMYHAFQSAQKNFDKILEEIQAYRKKHLS